MESDELLKKEHIQVFLRIRPLLPKETQEGEIPMWKASNNCIQMDLQQLQKTKEKRSIISPLNKIFFYSLCYGDNYSNNQIYYSAIQKLVQSSFNGYNGTIFMYGQTGSGKTHTMLGDYTIKEAPVMNSNGKLKPRNKTPLKNREAKLDTVYHHSSSTNEGLLTLSMKEIFAKVKKESSPHKSFFIKCSYFEIYNDYVFDLLSEDENNESLLICEDANKEFFIKGLTEVDVKDIDSILSILSHGEQSRHYAETVMNRHSSRSHTVFRIVSF